MTRQPLAFVTMVRGDHAMLDRWIAHHAALAGGPDALTVVSHGPDPRIARIARGASVLTIPFDPTGTEFEPRRMALLFGLVAGFVGYYRHVVVLDCDEFLALDPVAEMSLADYLDRARFDGVALSPAGFDVTQKRSVEPAPLNLVQPILAQRRHGVLHCGYCKPCIFRAPPPRGGNQHRLVGERWEIDPNLLLFHLRWADETMARQTGTDRERAFAAFDAAGRDHRIGLWSDRNRRLDHALARIDRAPCPDLTRAETEAFAARQIAHYDRRGGIPFWKEGMSDGRRLPDRLAGLL